MELREVAAQTIRGIKSCVSRGNSSDERRPGGRSVRGSRGLVSVSEPQFPAKTFKRGVVWFASSSFDETLRECRRGGSYRGSKSFV
jgi:hypothetical protein